MDENLKKTLTSFFQYSPRVYDDRRINYEILWHPGATSPSAPIYLLLFRVYYRLIMDKEGQKDFARVSSQVSGFGSNYFEGLFKSQLLSIETVADWCSLLGIKNRDVIHQMVETLQLKYNPFNDLMIGFFVDVQKKLEECCQLLIDVDNKARQDDYYLFIKDILYTISLLIQCLPTVCFSMDCWWIDGVFHCRFSSIFIV